MRVHACAVMCARTQTCGVSTLEECETEGEQSVTDGGVAPVTQFMEERCTERKEGKGRRAPMFSVGHVLSTCWS